MLDNLALVHMNGRVYDPLIGRFMSADPFVDAGAGTQGLNRYSYVGNNPLSFVDPSGYGLWNSIKNWINGAARLLGAFLRGVGFVHNFGMGNNGGSAADQPQGGSNGGGNGGGDGSGTSASFVWGGVGAATGQREYSDAGHGSTAGRKAVKPQIIPATGVQCDMTPCRTVAGASSTNGGVPGQNLSDAVYFYPGHYAVARYDLGPASLTVNGGLNLLSSLTHVSADLFAFVLQPFDTYAGEIISVETAIPGGGIAAGPTMLLGRMSASLRMANAARGPAATLELAQQIATHSKQTISIMETAEGPTLVAGGVRDLSAVQRALAVERGLTPVELPGFHAEKTLIHAAGERGLTPTRGVSTNNICGGSEGCRTFLEGLGAIVDGRFFSF